MAIVWIDTKEELPPQGIFVLCWDDGIAYTARRMGNCWFQIPFLDSSFAFYDPPEKWAHMTFPGGFTGKLRLKPEGAMDMYDAEEFELFHPKDFNEFVEALKKQMDERPVKRLKHKPSHKALA